MDVCVCLYMGMRATGKLAQNGKFMCERDVENFHRQRKKEKKWKGEEENPKNLNITNYDFIERTSKFMK